MSSRSENYIRNTVWGLISKLISILLPFLVRTVLIYKLDISYVGLNTLFSTIIQVLSLAELGFGSAMVYSMYKPIAQKDKKALCALLRLYRNIYKIIGGIVLGIGILIMPILPKLINGAYPKDINIYVLYLIYLLNTVSSYLLFAYQSSLLNANQRNDIRNKINMLVNMGLYIMQIIVLLVTSNYYIYIILLPVSTIINNIVAAYKSKKMYPDIVCRGKIDEVTKREIRVQVISLLWHKMGNTIIFSFDSIVISYFLGLRVLGMYNNYFYIYNSVASLFSIFYESIIPGVGNSLIVESKEKNYKDFCDFNSINFMLMGFCSSCLLCLYQPFMKVWQGSKLMCEFSVPLLLSILFLLWHSRRMIHTYKDSAGLWELDKYRPITEAFVNLGLNIILVNYFELKGVILSTIISIVVVGMPWEIKKFIGDFFGENIKLYLKMYFVQMLKSILVCSISFGVCYLIPNNGILWFIIKSIVCVIVSALGVLILFKNSDSYKRIVSIMKNRLKKVI